MKAWASHRRGFTIIEIMVIIVVIGILTTIVVVSFTAIQKGNRDGQRDNDITEVQRALEKYYADNGQYPLPAGDVDNTGYPLSSLSTLLAPYIASIPTAPSTNQYQYVRGGTNGSAYGIRMYYEGRPDCHKGVNNQGISWWSLPACAT